MDRLEIDFYFTRFLPTLLGICACVNTSLHVFLSRNKGQTFFLFWSRNYTVVMNTEENRCREERLQRRRLRERRARARETAEEREVRLARRRERYRARRRTGKVNLAAFFTLIL